MRQRSAASGRAGLLVSHQPCAWPRESHGLDVPGLRCHVLLAADRPDMLGAGWRCSGALTVTCTNGSIGLIPMVGSAAAAFPRDISAELVKVLGCVPVSVLLAFMASTERPPHTSARAESGVVLGAREVAEVRKFVSTGRPGFGCSNRPSNQLVHRNDYQSGEHDSDSFLDITCSEEADYGQETKEPEQSLNSTHIRKMYAGVPPLEKGSARHPEG